MIEVLLQHKHLFLAEYDRRLIVYRRGAGVVAQSDLFPDTGGYSRVNLYRAAEGELLIVTNADHVRISGTSGELLGSTHGQNEVLRPGEVYLGSFKIHEGRFDFWEPHELPRQSCRTGDL